MLNSIFDKKPQKIILDRIVYIDETLQEIFFSNDPSIIEKETINHFKNIRASNSSPQ